MYDPQFIMVPTGGMTHRRHFGLKILRREKSVVPEDCCYKTVLVRVDFFTYIKTEEIRGLRTTSVIVHFWCWLHQRHGQDWFSQQRYEMG